MHKLSTRDKNFPARLEAWAGLREEAASGVAPTVSKIIADVKKRGDQALIEYTKKFDDYAITKETLAVSPEEMALALAHTDKDVVASLKLAAKRIKNYSKKQLPKDLDYTDNEGIRLGHRWTPLDAVGVYVPGGLAAYPSSVLMNAVPAKVAGVERVVMVVPAPKGAVSLEVLAAAHIAGVDEIYTVGGAQAVAALAHGTDTIEAVDKIVGPGNAYVAEAKRQVFGTVGIDMIAGPSEILVIAQSRQNPAWIAADLLSQAEHDALAQSILITDDEDLALKVVSEVKRILKTLPRRDIAAASWEKFGTVILVRNPTEACAISDFIAPEHLQLMVDEPSTWLPNLRHAGAIFLGSHTPEAIGDYIAGPSHVLPTSRTARFSSGLSVFDFLKRTSIIGCSESGFNAIAAAAERLADAEKLGAHALSLRVRRT